MLLQQRSGRWLFDGDIAQAIGAEGQSEQWSALITLNKYKKNLDKGYKLGFASSMTPFAGFIYPIYGLLTSNADNPDMGGVPVLAVHRRRLVRQRRAEDQRRFGFNGMTTAITRQYQSESYRRRQDGQGME